jgi:hypothetical protein
MNQNHKPDKRRLNVSLGHLDSLEIKSVVPLEPQE